MTGTFMSTKYHGVLLLISYIFLVFLVFSFLFLPRHVLEAITKMRFFFTCALPAILASVVATSTPPISGPDPDPVDDLANEGLDNLAAYEKSHPSSNKTCTVENAAVRREWWVIYIPRGCTMPDSTNSMIKQTGALSPTPNDETTSMPCTVSYPVPRNSQLKTHRVSATASTTLYRFISETPRQSMGR